MMNASSIITSQQPIGIFDSGIGGLTVARAVNKLLPHEKMIYFGDTAHLPYGDKSAAAIQAYTIKICDMLLQQKCKLILIACHSASSAAYDLAKEYVASKAKVINVIEPTINYLREHHAKQKIGLIGTRQTVNSNIYLKKINELKLDIELKALATPLLVPLIEEGYADNHALFEILESYLSQAELKNIDALLLGCTHYPLLKKPIDKYYQEKKEKIILIDPADITAKAVKGFLEHEQLLNPSPNPSHHFYFSDYSDSLVQNAKFFFPTALHFEHYPLWE
jgi:glutamate racemase